MEVAEIQSWDDLYKHYHHECHRSEPKFRESVQDLGEPDRIALCKTLGWTYDIDEWPHLMVSMHMKMQVKNLDNTFPPPKEEPIVETITRPRLHPMFFFQDKKYTELYPPMDETTYERTKQSVRDHGFINPVTISDQGVLYDGNHRLRIWRELQEEGLDIKLPYSVKNFDTEEELLEFLRIKNEYRRHIITRDRVKAGGSE